MLPPERQGFPGGTQKALNTKPKKMAYQTSSKYNIDAPNETQLRKVIDKPQTGGKCP